jgi:hypothetical protein
MMRKTLLLGAAALLFLGTAAYAHHSYSATYDVNKEVTLEGKLVQFTYRNPHAFVTLQAPDQKGAEKRWAIEWAGTSQLGNSGIRQETLKVGDQLVITGNPSRVTGEYRVLMVTLKRPADGFSWGTRAGERVD